MREEINCVTDKNDKRGCLKELSHETGWAYDHKIYLYTKSARLSVQLSKWVPHSLTRKRVLLPPPLGPRGETHSLAGEGFGRPSSCTLVLLVYYNPSTFENVFVC